MTDPALAWVVRGALAVLLVTAAWHKLRDLPTFAATVSDYRLLPPPLVAISSRLFPAAELLVAALLVAPALSAHPRLLFAGAQGALALFTLYGVAIGWNLARGRRHIDCGCLGPAGRRELSEWLVVRNAGLAVAAFGLLLGVTPRPLSWLDAVSVVGGVVACVLVWTAAHTLASSRAAGAFGSAA